MKILGIMGRADEGKFCICNGIPICRPGKDHVQGLDGFGGGAEIAVFLLITTLGNDLALGICDNGISPVDALHHSTPAFVYETLGHVFLLLWKLKSESCGYLFLSMRMRGRGILWAKMGGLLLEHRL